MKPVKLEHFRDIPEYLRKVTFSQRMEAAKVRVRIPGILEAALSQVRFAGA
jgi:hypothetical protein